MKKKTSLVLSPKIVLSSNPINPAQEQDNSGREILSRLLDSAVDYFQIPTLGPRLPGLVGTVYERFQLAYNQLSIEQRQRFLNNYIAWIKKVYENAGELDRLKLDLRIEQVRKEIELQEQLKKLKQVEEQGDIKIEIDRQNLESLKQDVRLKKLQGDEIQARIDKMNAPPPKQPRPLSIPEEIEKEVEEAAESEIRLEELRQRLKARRPQYEQRIDQLINARLDRLRNRM